MKIDNKIRVGVVGVGYLGSHHARIYSAMNDVELVGVADENKDRADEIAGRYNTTAFYDYRDLLNRVQAVSIATPTTLHYPVTLDFIRHGIDVLIEKPITASIDEADSLINEAEGKGVHIEVGHIERFNKAFIAMNKYVNNPRFIESHRMGPYVGRGIDVDVILDLMIHDIDIILSVVKSDINDIRATGVPVLTNNIDIANARIEFDNGCIANVTASRVSKDKMRKIRIFQPDMYLSLDYGQQSMAIYRKIIKDGSPAITGEEIRLEREEPLFAELTSFIAAIRNKSKPVVSGIDGRKALSAALKILEDARKRLQD